MKYKIYTPLSVERCREILSKEAEGLSNSEIVEIRDSLARKISAI